MCGTAVEDDYQVKLGRIVADIESDAIDRLTLAIGRERYQMRDSRTKRAQRELSAQALLVKRGRSFVVVRAVAA